MKLLVADSWRLNRLAGQRRCLSVTDHRCQDGLRRVAFAEPTRIYTCLLYPGVLKASSKPSRRPRGARWRPAGSEPSPPPIHYLFFGQAERMALLRHTRHILTIPTLCAPNNAIGNTQQPDDC